MLIEINIKDTIKIPYIISLYFYYGDFARISPMKTHHNRNRTRWFGCFDAEKVRIDMMDSFLPFKYWLNLRKQGTKGEEIFGVFWIDDCFLTPQTNDVYIICF